MTQEEKKLLLEDLCNRLPYGVKCNVGDNKPYTLSKIEVDSLNGHLLDFIEMKDGLNIQVYLSEVKPYLFPLSSMTEEEKKELLEISNFNSDIDEICDDFIIFIERTSIDIVDIVNFISYLNAHHFDYRGLIPMGIANNATGLNIY